MRLVRLMTDVQAEERVCRGRTCEGRLPSTHVFPDSMHAGGLLGLSWPYPSHPREMAAAPDRTLLNLCVAS